MPLALALLGVIVSAALALWLAVVRRRLCECRETFDALCTKAPIGILRADATGCCTFANEAWYELSGLGPAEAIGHSWSRAVHPDDVASVMRKWEESVRAGGPYLNEVRVVRPDGAERTVLASAAPITDSSGRIRGFIGTAIDMSGRRTAERQAREQSALLQAFIDHSPALIYVKDAAGRYLLVNRRSAELSPAMRDAWPGTTPFDWFSEEVARSFLETDRRVLESGAVQTFEEVVPSADGPRTYISVKFPVLDEAGQTVAVGGVSTDVTDLERARRELAARERLLRNLIEVQERERQVLCQEFHDGLIQYAVGSKMLLESLRDLPDDAAGAALVETVIDYLGKGIEDGRRVIRGIRPQVLDDLGLRAALDDLGTDVRAAGIEVDARIDPAIDAGHPQLQTTIYRIVQEALANARKHSGTDRLRLDVARVEGRLIAVVEDFGQGFDPATPAGAAAEDGEGGLGLLGIRERARLAGGSCEVDAARGRGTCIRVTLPWRPEPDDG